MSKAQDKLAQETSVIALAEKFVVRYSGDDGEEQEEWFSNIGAALNLERSIWAEEAAMSKAYEEDGDVKVLYDPKVYAVHTDDYFSETQVKVTPAHLSELLLLARKQVKRGQQ